MLFFSNLLSAYQDKGLDNKLIAVFSKYLKIGKS